MTASNSNSSSSLPSTAHITKRDFPTPTSTSSSQHTRTPSRTLSLDSQDGLMGNLASELAERDRRRLARTLFRYATFFWAVFACLGAGSVSAFSLYGPLFLTRLHYTQLRVNAVSIAAAVAQYLPMSLFGYMCDRFGPSIVSGMSGVLFGGGYLLAAFTYRAGPPKDTFNGSEGEGEGGFPFWVMVLAFVGVGMGTTSLYISAVSTCVKNFGRGKGKGIVLAVPITAIGLSGMWQSQVGTRLLYESVPAAMGGGRGEVDVFRYFVFLAVLLMVAGFGGIVFLRVVDEEELIEEAVEELERSGLLEESEFFRRSEGHHHRHSHRGYGALDQDDEEGEEVLSDDERRALEEEKRMKTWLLNQETRRFLKDPTAWAVTVGVFLAIGTGEGFINNLGTIVKTLNAGVPGSSEPAGQPSTHVTIFAITSTLARLLLGALSDFISPSADPHRHADEEDADETASIDDSSLPIPPPTPSTSTQKKNFISIPRPLLLIFTTSALALAFFLLSTPLSQSSPGPTFRLITALVGFSYGATFSLVPIVISIVWGVENFGTNWGIVGMVPALGSAVAGVGFGVGYDAGLSRGGDHDVGGVCVGWECYGGWALGCCAAAVGSAVAFGLAWRVWRSGRAVVV